MKILRTPDERFSALEGYDFEPRYCEIRDSQGTSLRIHAIDEGPRDAKPILLMHGNPTWAYLYRKFVPTLVAAGHRVVAVDLVGCGRSDKPAARSDYTLERHCEWMSLWLEAMELRNVTLFCQDWGGTLGLHLVAQHGERFDRVIASNTGVPLGQGESEFMKMWVSMMRDAKSFPFAQMLPAGCSRELSKAELAAYLAPFPDTDTDSGADAQSDCFQAGILEFPALISVQADNPGLPRNRATWAALGKFEKPFLTLWGAKDIVAPGGDKALQAHIPGASGQPHHVFPDANHFIQEDVPEELCERILAFIEATR